MKYLLLAWDYADDCGLLLVALVAGPFALAFGPQILPWMLLGALVVVVSQIRTY